MVKLGAGPCFSHHFEIFIIDLKIFLNLLDVHHESVSSRINPEIVLAIWKSRGEKRRRK